MLKERNLRAAGLIEEWLARATMLGDVVLFHQVGVPDAATIRRKRLFNITFVLLGKLHLTHCVTHRWPLRRHRPIHFRVDLLGDSLVLDVVHGRHVAL